VAFEAFNNNYRPHRSTLDLIAKANSIINEYVPLGLRLTVRQLFYQFVARTFIENTQSEYKRLADHISNARDGGKIDWDAIEDRTRHFNVMYGWLDPAHRIRSAAESYREDLWLRQYHHVEVWIEKEALLGIIEDICEQLRVPYCAHRGSASSSFVHQAGKRLAGICRQGRKPVVLHLADHDPTGIHMTDDLRERLSLYARTPIEVRRIALTLTQARPLPPNTAKEDDSRYDAYVAQFGFEDCWELDALPPDVLVDLIRTNVEQLMDAGAWNAARRREARNRKLITRVADNWAKVQKILKA
jgi:hypothetical protein